MAKTLYDKYFAALKTQQLARAELHAAEKNLRETIMWHARNEQMYAALNSTVGNTIFILDGPKPVWEFGMYGDPSYKMVASVEAYGDEVVIGTKTNNLMLWRVDCDARIAQLFWGEYPDIAKYNLAAIEGAQTEVQRRVQRYNAAIAATNAAEQALQAQI